MVRQNRALSAGLAGLVLAGCCEAPRLVEVPVAVEVPGPVEYLPVPLDLLDCGARPPSLKSGMTGGELRRAALAWQSFGRCYLIQTDLIRDELAKKSRPAGEPGG